MASTAAGKEGCELINFVPLQTGSSGTITAILFFCLKISVSSVYQEREPHWFLSGGSKEREAKCHPGMFSPSEQQH